MLMNRINEDSDVFTLPYLLWTLRKRIKISLFSCRNNEFSCAFRSWFKQHGRLYLCKSIVNQVISNCIGCYRSQANITLKLFSTKIQVTITESDFLIWLYQGWIQCLLILLFFLPFGLDLAKRVKRVKQGLSSKACRFQLQFLLFFAFYLPYPLDAFGQCLQHKWHFLQTRIGFATWVVDCRYERQVVLFQNDHTRG